MLALGQRNGSGADRHRLLHRRGLARRAALMTQPIARPHAWSFCTTACRAKPCWKPSTWKRRSRREPALYPPRLDYNDVLLRLLGALNICSRESVIRQYDHEVKGRTIVKPLMGATGQAPQDAAVVRFNFESWEGVAVSNGILPALRRFGRLPDVGRLV
ncbi:MAG: hypothetical protein WKG07_14350 [Hymenobacter sp.]